MTRLLDSNFYKSLFCYELFFVLFLFSSRFKADERLSWMPMDLTLLTLAFCLFGVFFVFLKNSFRFKVGNNSLLIFFLLYMFFIAISFAWSPSKVYAFEKMLHFLTLTFFSFFSAYGIVSQERKRLIRFLFWFGVFSLWMLVEAILAIAFGNKGFVNVLGGNYLALGRVVGMFVVLTYVLIIFYKAPTIAQRIGLYLLFGASFFVLFYAGSRGPLISSVGVMLLSSFMMVEVKRGAVLMKKATFSYFIMLTALLIFFLYFLYNPEKSQTMLRLLVLTEDGMGESAGSRLKHYTNGLAFWLENPIFGHGVGAWPILNNAPDERSYPHNIFIESLVEFGLIGFIFIFLSLFKPILAFISRLRLIKLYWLPVAIFSIFLYWFFNAQTSGDLNDNRYLFTFLGLMNYIFLFIKLKTGNQR